MNRRKFFKEFLKIFLDKNIGYLVQIDKQHEEVSADYDFKAYYVSIVPGQNLMRDQVWDRVGN